MKIIGVIVLVLMIILARSYVMVPAGYIGVKVNLLGDKKGVDLEELGVGRYFLTINEEMYLFPTFTQNYVWTASSTEGSEKNEAITFQTMKGLNVSADVGISYFIESDAAARVFQKYRRGVDEITHIYIRNMVRDAFVEIASQHDVEYIYGVGKSELMKSVTELVRSQVKDIGINVEKIYLVGEMTLPPSVMQAINEKIGATQKAQMRQNEVAEAVAAAEKAVATAQGEADSILAVATAQAEANKILSQSLTDKLIQIKMVEKWDGALPYVSGSSTQLMKLPEVSK